MTTEDFFKQLLDKTKQAFIDSPIYQKQKTLGKDWNYSICGSPIQLGKGILMGINWGEDGNHEPLSAMPNGKDIASYNFIKRSKNYLETYLHLDLNTVDFNCCRLVS